MKLLSVMDVGILRRPATMFPSLEQDDQKLVVHSWPKRFLRNGDVKFYALKTYCYKSIIDSLETLLKRPGLEEQCEKWKTRKIDDNMYADVYDVKVWKQFGNWKGNKPFLNLPRSFGLMMNVDWFKPFKHRIDFSVGVIYMVLMNLPRSIRFKKEKCYPGWHHSCSQT